MGSLITLSIDPSKIDQSKIKEFASGKKNLEITISVSDETNDYGQNVSAYHAQSKEQQAAKEKKAYLGNGKVFWTDGKITKAEYRERPNSNPSVTTNAMNPLGDASDDLSF